MELLLFNGSNPVRVTIEQNDYKPRLTLDDGTCQITVELSDEDSKSLGEYLLDGQITDFEDDLAELQKDNDNLEDKLSDLQSEMDDLESTVKAQEKEIDELKTRLEDYEPE